MKTIRILLLAVLTALISSCHHTVESPYIPQSVTRLNTVVAPWQKDNDLLPWVRVNHTDIINSVADVHATQTARFIEENPEWLNVDFAAKSIISVRTLLVSSNYWKSTKVVAFSLFDGDQDYHMVKGDYYLIVEDDYTSYDTAEDEDESQYRIYQIAFVTEKVPSDARIKINWGLRISPAARQP